MDKAYIIAEWLVYNHGSLKLENLKQEAQLAFARVLSDEDIEVAFSDERVKVIIDFYFTGRDDYEKDTIH